MAALMPLSRGLQRDADSCVAVQGGHAQSAAAFQLRVQGWMAVLRDRPHGRWAVYHADASEFLAILFALWQLGRSACIPGDNRPGTVQRLAACVAGFAGQFSAVEAVEKPCGEPAGAVPWRTPAADFVALEIYTSGSSGEPKPITKTIAQLEREIEALESLWPSQAGSVVLATVTHQHLYGLTFRLLWPFCTARPFARTLCEYPEDILRQAGHYPAFSLVSSPSHLGRINSAVDWADIAQRCHGVVSSAAPLARGDSLLVGQLLQAPVHEIYGSSETGAIAWRAQQAGGADARWQALPGVRLSAAPDGTLCIRSAYQGTRAAVNLPDRVDFDRDGCFGLLGRVDRIVKVEGKRVSLAAIERLLLSSPLVTAARALTLQRTRVETAVVVQLSAEACGLLRGAGRKGLVKALKALLAGHLEAVVLPRRWRFVGQMPYNLQGKLPVDTLQAMFDKEPLKWPEILHQQVAAGEATLACHIPAELIYFDGHFAGNPILPGIVQVHWAEAFGRRLLPLNGRFKQLEVVKFQQVIAPGYTVSLHLDYDAASQKLTFRYESDRGVHSSGRICFA